MEPAALFWGDNFPGQCFPLFASDGLAFMLSLIACQTVKQPCLSVLLSSGNTAPAYLLIRGVVDQFEVPFLFFFNTRHKKIIEESCRNAPEMYLRTLE